MSADHLKRVLVVDDDAQTRSMLSSAFTNAGLAVDCAADGQVALTMAADRHYAVIVLDLLMPVADGMFVLGALRKPAPQFEPVVIVITGAEPEVYASLDARLVHGIVRKPFDPDELTNLVRSCVEIRSRAPYDKMIAAAIAGGPLMMWLSKF